MKVKDVMSSQAVTVDPGAPFDAVVDTLIERRVSQVPVVDGTGLLVGIVTEADLLAKEAFGGRRPRALELVADYLVGREPKWLSKAAGLTAADVMTLNVETVDPGMDLVAAGRRMLESGHKCLPVVDGGQLVGVLTRHDVLRPFHRSDEEIVSEVYRVLSDPAQTPETARVEAAVCHGVVTLMGSVDSPRDVPLVEAVVGRLPGVVAVDVRLTAREPDPHL